MKHLFILAGLLIAISSRLAAQTHHSTTTIFGKEYWLEAVPQYIMVEIGDTCNSPYLSFPLCHEGTYFRLCLDKPGAKWEQIVPWKDSAAVVVELLTIIKENAQLIARRDRQIDSLSQVVQKVRK